MQNYKDLQQVFKILADVNRLRIIEALTIECETVNEIADKAGISQPLTSHHLRELKRVGIVRFEKRGSSHLY